MDQPITGTAAGVPFTALAPAETPAPLILTWHMMDPPRSPGAFAAALPMAGVAAWRVHLGLPVIRDGGVPAVIERAMTDAVLSYVDPVVSQAVEELPAVLTELRERLPIEDGPIGVVGGSLGAAVALRVLADATTPVAAAAVVNAAVRVRSMIGLIEQEMGRRYPWTAESTAAADRLDFVARAGDIAAGGAALLVVSGEQDVPVFRADAAELAAALRARYGQPGRVGFTTVPDLGHPLAEEPGVDAVPGLPVAKVVDDALTGWFVQHLR